MRTKLAAIALAMLMLVGTSSAQETAKRQVSLWIFDARIRSFAPGLDAAIGLTGDQAKQLAAAYAEVFNTNAAALANMVLEDDGPSMAQRQMATATLQQAQAAFQMKGRTIFTEKQRGLIDKVYASFARVHDAAQQAMVQKVTADFAKELDAMLTPEQKDAVKQARAAIEEANKRKAEAAKKPEGG